jgi:hypothetical protein
LKRANEAIALASKALVLVAERVGQLGINDPELVARLDEIENRLHVLMIDEWREDMA